MKRVEFKHKAIAACVAFASLGGATVTHASVLTNYSYEKSNKGGYDVIMSFDSIPDIEVFKDMDKNIISIDLESTTLDSSIPRSVKGTESLKSIEVAEDRGDSRLQIELEKITKHEIKRDGNAIKLHISDTLQVEKKQDNSFDFNKNITKFENADFRLTDKSRQGQVVISLNRDDVNVNIHGDESKIIVDLADVNVTEDWTYRLDVKDFGTSVQFVDMFQNGKDARIVMEISELSDYSAFQMDKDIIIDIRPFSEIKREQSSDVSFSDRKLNFNFENGDLRSVLYTFAEFTDMNVVISDSVSGEISLNLKGVAPEKILDLILRSKGLDKRVDGDILLIAPAEELAQREKIQLENQKNLNALAPMHTEFIRINYADAKEIAGLFIMGADDTDNVEQLTDGGIIRVDERTNTLVVTDTRQKINEYKQIIDQIDRPVPQVMVEARIVITSTDVAEELGVRWTAERINNVFASERSTSGYGSAGNALAGSLSEVTNIYKEAEVSYNNPIIDMGVANPSSSLAFGYLGSNALIGLELSALQSEGSAEVISTPKIITSDKQEAKIESGTQIPYQEATSSGATSTSFKDAVLSLSVRPQITPDNNIILDLNIKQDSVGEIFNNIPSINTQEIDTQVLVKNGETLVLGGIYRQEELNQLLKTPILGDIPGIGRLFKKTVENNEKMELLVFVTPRIIGTLR